MGKWVRWQGIVAFVVVAGLFATIWFLVVDGLVKRTIEQTGTAIVGAKVELDRADLSLFPLGLTLERLQVTNPEEPMRNAVEIGRIAGSLDGLNLLRRKVIIEEMALDGLRLNTPRTSSGVIVKVQQKEAAPSKTGGFALPSVQLNDPKDILAKELDELKSVKLVESLRADVQAEKKRWQQQIAELPDKAKLDEYKTRIESLKSAGKGGLSGILGGVSEVSKIHAELKRDLDKITGAKKELEQTVTSLTRRAEEAAKTPQEDARRLMDKYSFSGQGLANVSRAVFAGPLGEWVVTAIRWRHRLEPLLARSAKKKADVEVVKPVRGKGVDVRFKEQAPLPDLLVRAARVSLEIPAGIVKGLVNNITPDQHILGSPVTFAFSGRNLKGLDSIELDGAINRVDPATPTDSAKLRIAGYRIENLALGGGGAGVALKSGVADLDLRAKLRGPSLDATVGSKVRSVRIATGEKLTQGQVGSAIASALADVNAFEVKADVSGTEDNYQVALTSDLDKVLMNAVGKQVQAQTAKLEGQLRAAIDEKIKAQLAELRGNLGGFDPLLQDLVSRLNVGRDILKIDVGKSGLKLPF